ncbi:hypothetical protein VVMO6_00739 [Vibrio vulnificus MO6-24/O]|nr:hypothetical protein VVMO6_00739 [Vibrio vulnificus MO6-24/O]
MPHVFAIVVIQYSSGMDRFIIQYFIKQKLGIGNRVWTIELRTILRAAI